MKKITSAHNPLIKRYRLLQQKSKERKRQGCFVIEGFREMERAQHAGYKWDSLLIREGALKTKHFPLHTWGTHTPIFEIETELFDKISYRSGSERTLGIAKMKSHTLDELQLLNKPLLVVVEAAEKPGNIGAILRTAAATRIDAVLFADAKTDLYNPNSIRASLGGIFGIPIAQDSTSNTIAYLKENEITPVAAALSNISISHHQFTYPPPCAIIMGSEADGLSDSWLSESHVHVKIPMHGQIDSLNLSVSAGILIYEMLKQNNRL